MKRAIDIAALILSELNDIFTMKVQKLALYLQAYHLVTVDEPLFSEQIEA